MKEINYRENMPDSKVYKENYVNEIIGIIADREAAAVAKRDNYCRDIFIEQEKYREKFKAMLGWPLTGDKDHSVPYAKMKKLADDNVCSIYRVSVEVMSGFFMTGLLFQKDEKKRSLVIVQHGGGGTPELVGNLYGDTRNYNRIIERILKYDANVFAPQLLIWDEPHQVDYDRTALDAQLKRVGSSITALEIYGLSRILDYFEVQPYVSNFGMAGLSYGGFYTMFMAAVDTRIKAAVSCAFFNNRKNFVFNDWAWFGAAETFSDAEIACLVYPRKLCIQVGINDPLFEIKSAEEELERLKAMSKTVAGDWLDIIKFKGEHEFCWDDEPLKKLVEDIR